MGYQAGHFMYCTVQFYPISFAGFQQLACIYRVENSVYPGQLAPWSYIIFKTGNIWVQHIKGP